MPCKDDVLGVRTGLEYRWPRKAIPDASSLFEGTTKHHIFGNIDGDEPVRSHKDFVVDEALPIASGHTQEACEDYASYRV